MIGKQGLYGICFGATLLCLSYSVPGVNWSFVSAYCAIEGRKEIY
jgi:hypothetical protein